MAAGIIDGAGALIKGATPAQSAGIAIGKWALKLIAKDTLKPHLEAGKAIVITSTICADGKKAFGIYNLPGGTPNAKGIPWKPGITSYYRNTSRLIASDFGYDSGATSSAGPVIELNN